MDNRARADVVRKRGDGKGDEVTLRVCRAR